jgi:hypothetical protein
MTMAEIELIRGADNGNLPADTLRMMYPKVNRNFARLNNEADALDQRLKNQDIRIDNIVSQSGDDITEIVDARYSAPKDVTFPVLKDRMDASEEDVIALQAETATGIFNVVNGYNADPTGVTDSATAIQSAINAAYAAGGGVVYFPDGSYKTDTTITMKPSVFLRGSSPGNVLYDKGTPTGAVIQYLGSEWAIKFTEVPNASQSGLININITGNTSALGGVKINDTTVDTDPSLDLYFSGVCVAYFPNGYGFHLTTTYRDAFYSVIIRQCGCGFSTLESNDLTMVDTTFEWCALGASFRLSASINMYGTLAEGLGVRPDVNLPSDIYVWSDYSGRTLDYYHGGIRNFGSSLTMVGTYM